MRINIWIDWSMFVLGAFWGRWVTVPAVVGPEKFSALGIQVGPFSCLIKRLKK